MDHQEALVAVHLALCGTGDDDPSDDLPVIFENYSAHNRMDDEELEKWRPASEQEYARYVKYYEDEWDREEGEGG